MLKKGSLWELAFWKRLQVFRRGGAKIKISLFTQISMLLTSRDQLYCAYPPLLKWRHSSCSLASVQYNSRRVKATGKEGRKETIATVLGQGDPATGPTVSSGPQIVDFCLSISTCFFQYEL